MIVVSEEKKKALKEKIEECYGSKLVDYHVNYSEGREGLVAVVRWSNTLNTSKFVWEKNEYGEGYFWARKSDD
ncbi:hypothetical protein NRA66_16305 [Acinetobacter baumannii]|nr:hypothetical protein [Acinetobacter baumannii]